MTIQPHAGYLGVRGRLPLTWREGIPRGSVAVPASDSFGAAPLKSRRKKILAASYGEYQGRRYTGQDVLDGVNRAQKFREISVLTVLLALLTLGSTLPGGKPDFDEILSGMGFDDEFLADSFPEKAKLCEGVLTALGDLRAVGLVKPGIPSGVELHHLG